tara:strand:- start:225 stop:2636 length:2412 start_codon:yes stop_codon:yes gene_type:complete
MDCVNEFKKRKYVIWNVSPKKTPMLKNGYGGGWNKITHNEVKQYWGKSNNWGMRTGRQENGDYIIGLDFDMWVKEGLSYVVSQNTRDLFAKQQEINPDNIGVFESSTQLNRGVLVNIKKSKKLMKMMDELPLNIQRTNYCLEILNGFNMILPPSITPCKIDKKPVRTRKFMGETMIYDIEDNEDAMVSFISEYITAYRKDKGENKKKQYKSKKVSTAIGEYQEAIEDEPDQDYIKYVELVNPFLNCLKDFRYTKYEDWWKIGTALKNSFGKDGLAPFIKFSKKICKDDEEQKGKYVEEDCKKSWPSWGNREDYEGLNVNWIMSIAQKDNEERFGDLLLQYENKKEKYELKMKAKEFEKNVRKVLEPPVWLKKHRKTGEWEMVKHEEKGKSDIRHIYAELGFSREFIKLYTEEYNEKNYYDFMDFIPDIKFKEVDEKTKTKTFNSFKGFENLNYKKTIPEEDKKKYISMFETHIKIMGNGDANAVVMIRNYMTNLFWDTLKKVNICLIISGLEGSGKTSLYQLIEALIGQRYTYSIENLDYIFGDKNPMLRDKLFINIDEMDNKTINKFMERFKKFITDSKMTIRDLYMSPYECANFIRFMITTNNPQLFKTSMTDRRFYMMLCSGEMIGNTSYFSEFYSALENPAFLKTILEYLKENFESQKYKDFSFEKHQKDSKTEFHLSNGQVSRTTFAEFLEDMIINWEEEEMETLTPIQLKTKWIDFCSAGEYNSRSMTYETLKSKFEIINRKFYTQNDQRKRIWKLNKKQIYDWLVLTKNWSGEFDYEGIKIDVCDIIDDEVEPEPK